MIDELPVFLLKLEKTYYENGYFNVRVPLRRICERG